MKVDLDKVAMGSGVASASGVMLGDGVVVSSMTKWDGEGCGVIFTGVRCAGCTCANTW
jgi:hypothetical protein